MLITKMNLLCISVALQASLSDARPVIRHNNLQHARAISLQPSHRSTQQHNQLLSQQQTRLLNPLHNQQFNHHRNQQGNLPVGKNDIIMRVCH